MLWMFLFCQLVIPEVYAADKIVVVAEKPETMIEEKITEGSAEYSVQVDPNKKRVEVTRVGDSKSAPPHLRLRVYRKNDRPLDIGLAAVDVANNPLRYSGRIDRWSQSHMGLELQFSFDKKTWKRLGNLFQ